MNDGPDARHRPRLLLITGHRWLDTCRVALAAREAGFAVGLIGPTRHPVAALEWVTQVGTYSSLQPGRSVARALNRCPCELLVPVDDLGAAALFEAHAAGWFERRAAGAVRRSLGDPASFGVRHARAVLAEIAAAAGLPAPQTWAVEDADALPALIAAAGLPAVLKADGGSGGERVRIVADLAGARAAHRTLSRPPRMVSALGWLVHDHDAGPLRSVLLRERPHVTLQEFLPGDQATLSAVAWRGEVIGSMSFRAVRTRSACGPATVVEPLQHPDMDRAARVIAARLGLSGLFGLDFALAPDHSCASLLELNPRATPTSHLYVGTMRRPPLHLLAERLGADAPAPLAPPLSRRIALFPQVMLWGQAVGDDADADFDLPHAPEVLELCRSALSALPLGGGRTGAPGGALGGALGGAPAGAPAGAPGVLP